MDFQGLPPRAWDLICVTFIVALNPLLFLHQHSVSGLFIDSVAYINAASALWTDGSLYIAGWGHVDTGLILPPVYPFLIGLLSPWVEDQLTAAEYVSSLALVLSSVPMYLYVASLRGRLVAVLAVVVVQLNYQYLLIGTSGLTEAVFLLLVSTGLWWQRRSFSKVCVASSDLFVLGLIAGLVLLTRQIGLVFFAALVLSTCVVMRSQPRALAGALIAATLGFSSLAMTYGIVLYAQTGHLPFNQQVRLGEYVVDADAHPPLADLKPKGGKATDYLELIETRRDERALTPDASEMYEKLVSTSNMKSPLLSQLEKTLTEPWSIPRRIGGNFGHLMEALGPVLPYLFVMTLLSALFFRRDRETYPVRVFLPLFVVVYLLTVSLLTDLVGRYMHVLFGIVIVHLFDELYRLSGMIRSRVSSAKAALLGAAAVTAVVLLSTPKLFTAAKLIPKVNMRAELGCRSFVQPGEPIFSFHPLYSFAFGGTYRIVPNDALPRIAVYAKRTGVRWLLLFEAPSEFDERSFYTRADWLRSPEPAAEHPELLRLRCVDTRGVTHRLYELMPPE